MLIFKFNSKFIKLDFNWSIFIRRFLIFNFWISMLFHKFTLFFQVILSQLFTRRVLTFIYIFIIINIWFLVHYLRRRLKSVIFTWLLYHFTLYLSFAFLKFILLFIVIFLICIDWCRQVIQILFLIFYIFIIGYSNHVFRQRPIVEEVIVLYQIY